MIIPSWEDAFEQSELGDKRRIKRAIRIAEQIEKKYDKRGASAALAGHSDLKAASRLLRSTKVSAERLTEGFIKMNCESITAPHVLIIEDTSEFNFAWRKKEINGLGPTGNGEDQGFFLHPAILVEADSEEVQGLAGLQIITRQHGQATTKGEIHKYKDISEKESYRWLEVPRKGAKRLPETTKKTIIGDREADIYDLFLAQYTGGFGENCELLIRASRDRKIQGVHEYLFAEVESWEVKGRHNVEISANRKRPARSAQCDIRYGTVTFEIPRTQRNRKGRVSIPNITVVDVREKEVMNDEEAIHWMLLTTWPVENIEQAIEKVRWYRCRWLIEELFRILKSGYHVESVRFDDGNALINWCAIRLMMAVKMMYVKTHRTDEHPESAKEIFSDIELEVLEACESQLISKNSTIYRPPAKTTAWATLLVAIMGGYQALPSAKPYGQTTLWRGFVTLEGAVLGYLAARENCG